MHMQGGHPPLLMHLYGGIVPARKFYIFYFSLIADGRINICNVLPFNKKHNKINRFSLL